jgi:hypothetical protein
MQRALRRLAMVQRRPAVVPPLRKMDRQLPRNRRRPVAVGRATHFESLEDLLAFIVRMVMKQQQCP